jgi:Uma2 family endonuclease
MADMVVQEKVHTVEELWELSHRSEYVDKRLELSEGRLIVMSPAGWKHGGIASKLDRKIGDFVEEHDLGITTAAETGYILYKNPDPDGKDTVRAPDIGCIAAARLPSGDIPDGYVPFAPDLAVEVVSPHDDPEDIHKKVTEYLKFGTRLVWVFYPKSRSVGAYTPTSFRSIDIDGVLDGGDVLPGFKVAVRDIFPK